jgi:hypothetical protein
MLRSAALAASIGAIPLEAAQHVHQAAAEEKQAAGGLYKPKCFNAHEFKTLQRLSDLIVPADEISKGALEAGAPEFIDLLASANDELAALYTGGIAWLDREMQRRHSARFVDAKPEQQTSMLDLIAYRKNDSPELGPGIRFFDWVRKMTVDAFYTSKAGVSDIGYKGNIGMTKFQVPLEAIEHAMKKSP